MGVFSKSVRLRICRILTFHLYTSGWEDAQQDIMTHGQSRLIRGESASPPDFEFYGCALLPIGTPMTVETANVVPVVTALLPDGKTIRGVTLGSMIASPDLQKRQQEEKLTKDSLERIQEEAYEEIMEPEEQRHAAVVKQEADRHEAVIRPLNLCCSVAVPSYIPDQSLTAAQQAAAAYAWQREHDRDQLKNATDLATQNSAAIKQEEDRHADAVRQEGQEYFSAQQAARQRAAYSSQPQVPVPTMPVAGGIPLPPIHNSPDAHCGYQRQCTEDEFVSVLDGLKKQWAIVPEWLRAKCASNSTFPSMEKCILTQTIAWLNTNPNAQAPWVNLDNLSKFYSKDESH